MDLADKKSLPIGKEGYSLINKQTNNHTFVICAYKESPYLEQAIESLLNQTLKSQIIMVTSTPNDYLAQIASKYQFPIFSHRDGNIGKDWNFGLSKVTTKYATIAHQDDIYCPEYLQTCMGMFQKNPDALIAFTDYDEMKDNQVIPKSRNMKIKRILLAPLKYFKHNRLIRNRVLALGCAICCPAVTYNLHTLSNFQFNHQMTVSLDWEAWYRIAQKKGAFCYSDHSLMYHRIHEESETTQAIQDSRREQEDQYMFEKFWPKWMANFLMKFYSKSQDSNNG